MKFEYHKIKILWIFLATIFVISQGCYVTPAPEPINDDAYFDLTNDTFDQVNVVIGGTLVDSLLPGETHTYDLGWPDTYNIQIGRTGDFTGELNNIDIYFISGVTTWSVYDNAPIITVTNDLPKDYVDITIDNLAQQFATAQYGNYSNVTSDWYVHPGETGFLLVDTDQTHLVDFYDYDPLTQTNTLLQPPSPYSHTFIDGDHKSFVVQ